MRGHVQRAALLAALCLACAPAAFAAGGKNRLTDIRHWSAPTYTRLVFDLRGETAWKVGELKAARSLAIELDGFDGFLPRRLVTINDGIVKSVRSLASGGTIRVLIDLEKPAEYKIFSLKKIGDKPARLVIDLTRADLEQAARDKRQETARRKKKGDFIVVIDPGHGGEDPGAVSAGGTYEKDLVLAIARKLAARLSAAPGIKAYLTRRGDYFIPLAKRIEIAGDYGADLFLSIHVNAGFSTTAAGSSVYCLSFKGASNNVARLAEARENASDSIGGVPLDQQNSNVNVILCDLVQTHTINSSVQLAGLLLEALGKINRLYLDAPQEANFAVLRAPDIPSVLIETDFISTPSREKMLKRADFQNRFASTVAATVARYRAARPQGPAGTAVQARQPGKKQLPPAPAAPVAAKRAPAHVPKPPAGGKYRVVKKGDTAYALVPAAAAPPQPATRPAASGADAGTKVMRYHVVKKHETLWSIARRYDLSLEELCRSNNLSRKAKIAAGMKLKIPRRPGAK